MRWLPYGPMRTQRSRGTETSAASFVDGFNETSMIESASWSCFGWESPPMPKTRMLTRSPAEPAATVFGTSLYLAELLVYSATTAKMMSTPKTMKSVISTADCVRVRFGSSLAMSARVAWGPLPSGFHLLYRVGRKSADMGLGLLALSVQGFLPLCIGSATDDGKRIEHAPRHDRSTALPHRSAHCVCRARRLAQRRAGRRLPGVPRREVRHPRHAHQHRQRP